MITKKRLAIFIFAALLVVGAVYLYQNRKVDVSFVFNEIANNKLEMRVYRIPGGGIKELDTQETSPVATIKKTSTVRLVADKYIVVSPGTERFRNYKKFFVAKDLLNVKLNPVYSTSYLEKLLEKETPAINNSLENQLIGLGNYKIIRQRLYAKGNWAGVVFTAAAAAPLNISSDYIRVVLKKESGSWNVVTEPYILLSRLRYPDIPEDILRDINQLQYQEFVR